MANEARRLSTRSDVWSRYADCLHGRSDAVAELGRALIEAGVSYGEFEAGHRALLPKDALPAEALARAATVRETVLAEFDRALADYRTMHARYRKELIMRRRESVALATDAEALMVSRDNYRSEIAIQARLLKERSDELESLNHRIVAQRDELAAFLYAISHDLKSPLNTIMTLLGFVTEDHADTGLDLVPVERAQATARRTLGMLDNLLDFSRTLDEAVAHESVDLDRLVAEVVEDIGPEHAGRDASITCDRLPLVSGSAFQLRLLFQNLVSNAVKFCPEDRAPEVRIGNKGPRGITHVAIAVTDNGIGIDPVHHERIFGLFNRLHTEADFPGTGIGLALCDRVVRNHSGRIHLSSSHGEGSTFCVVLPI